MIFDLYNAEARLKLMIKNVLNCHENNVTLQKKIKNLKGPKISF